MIKLQFSVLQYIVLPSVHTNVSEEHRYWNDGTGIDQYP